MEWLTEEYFHGIVSAGLFLKSIPFFAAIMTPIFLLCLYLAFRAKQFICDFLLQSQWIALNKGHKGAEGYRALAAHGAIHGAGTLMIMLVFAPGFWWLGAVDGVIHASIDRIKAVISDKRGWTYQDRWFWWSFGLDQEMHNLTHLLYIVIIAAYAGIRFF